MNPESKVGAFVLVALVLLGCWRIFVWFRNAKPTPNPWDEKTEESIQQPDASQICRRCLEPHEEFARYCPHCGIPVDSMVPLSPFHYAFAIGDVLLTGTQRKFPVNWLTITGFVFLSTIQYMVFAPVYWFRLIRNIKRLNEEANTVFDSTVESADFFHTNFKI